MHRASLECVGVWVGSWGCEGALRDWNMAAAAPLLKQLKSALCLSLVPSKEAVWRLSAVKCEVWRSARHQKRGFKSCFSTVPFPMTTIVLSLSDSPNNPEKTSVKQIFDIEWLLECPVKAFSWHRPLVSVYKEEDFLCKAEFLFEVTDGKLCWPAWKLNKTAGASG